MNVRGDAALEPLRFNARNAALFTAGGTGAALLGKMMAFPMAHAAIASFTMGFFLAILLLAERCTWLHWSALALVIDVLACITIQGESPLRAMGEGIGHVAASLLAAIFIVRFTRTPFLLNTLHEVLVLSLFSVVPGAALSAGLECGFDVLQQGRTSPLDFLRYWTGFSLAGLAVAPVVLTIRAARGKTALLIAGQRLEATSMMLITALLTHFIWSTSLPLVFLLLPIVVWNAMRFDIASMSLGLMLVALIALHHTGAGWGPYASPLYNPAASAVLIQSFIGIACFGGLVLSSVTAQRRVVLGDLTRARLELEARVEARTTALAQSERQSCENEDRFRLARGAARMIVIDWEIAPDIVTFSDAPEWLRGPLPAGGRYPYFKDQVHEEDRSRFLETRQRAVETLVGQTLEFRFVRTDGVILHVQSFQTMVAGTDGKAARLLAILQDITEQRHAEIALRESEQRMRALLDAIPDEVRLKDLKRRYVMVNRAAREYLGKSEAEIIGRTVFDLRPLEIARQIDGADQAAIAAGRIMRIERRSFYQADSWREIINFPIHDAHGTVTGIISLARDITERKLAELDALREREERYRTLVEQAGDFIYRIDARGYFTYTNHKALVDMLGYTRDEMIGRHCLDLVHSDYRDRAEAFYLRQFKEHIAATYFEMPLIAKEGRTVWVGQRVQLVTANDGSDSELYYQAVCRDISDRVAAQQALSAFNTKLRQLSARQEDLLESERTRLAHDLHDGIGQSVNLARIKLGALARRGDAGILAEELKAVLKVIDDTSAVIRTLEFDLSPPVLRELGLEPALEWLAEEMRRVYGLNVVLSSDGEPKALSQLVRAVAFRTVRELLINVVRHAGTLNAHVDTQVDNGYAVITVSDEGRGFDPGATPRGLGLTSVNERMTHVGGNATITAMRGEGAVISLQLPLEDGKPRRRANDYSSSRR